MSEVVSQAMRGRKWLKDGTISEPTMYYHECKCVGMSQWESCVLMRWFKGLDETRQSIEMHRIRTEGTRPVICARIEQVEII